MEKERKSQNEITHEIAPVLEELYGMPHQLYFVVKNKSVIEVEVEVRDALKKHHLEIYCSPVYLTICQMNTDVFIKI